jgi:hypothetical protein
LQYLSSQEFKGRGENKKILFTDDVTTKENMLAASPDP